MLISYYKAGPRIFYEGYRGGEEPRKAKNKHMLNKFKRLHSQIIKNTW